MKAMKKRLRVLIAIIAVLCMAFSMVSSVYATEDSQLTAAEDPRDSILLVTLGYQDDNGNYTPYQAGTCFMVNEEYVVTNKHVVTMTSADLEELGDLVGVPNLKATDDHICIKLYVNRDMKMNATMHENANSDDMDFAALQVEGNIPNRKPVKMGDSSTVSIEAQVRAVGFPEDSISTKEYNTRDDASIVGGTISKVTETGDVDIFEHTVPLNLGNSGGPLLDENNNVIGINTFMAGKKGYAIQINHIKSALDAFGIPYVSGDSAAVEESVEAGDDLTAERAELQSALDQAKGTDTEKCTEESVKALDDAIASAESVLKDSEATKEQLMSATDDLNIAVRGLEEKSGPSMLIIGLIAAAVIIVVVIVVIILRKPKMPKTNIPDASMSQGGGQAHTVNNVPQNGGQVYGAQQQEAMTQSSEGSGDTTLLDAGSTETTLLNATAGAYLIRKKTGEKIQLSRQIFKIGKEKNKVDYCISGNTSVSRVHCHIVKKGSDYYIIDQNSTNCTFVNNIQSNANKETLLTDQSVVKLSDEEFEFHMM